MARGMLTEILGVEGNFKRGGNFRGKGNLKGRVVRGSFKGNISGKGKF